MRTPLSLLSAALLLAACDGGSHQSVTAPPPPTAPSAALIFAGAATISGIGSEDPAGDCAAAAIRQDLGRAWNFQLELTDSGDGRTGTGRLTSPLLNGATCSFDYANTYGELEVRPMRRCEVTYGEWPYGSSCADAATTLQLIFMQVESFSLASHAFRSEGELMFERSPLPSFDLGVRLNFDLRRQ